MKATSVDQWTKYVWIYLREEYYEQIGREVDPLAYDGYGSTSFNRTQIGIHSTGRASYIEPISLPNLKP